MSMQCGAEHANRVNHALQASLGASQADLRKSFYEHGGDSLGFVRFALALAEHYGDEAFQLTAPDIPLEALAEILAGATGQQRSDEQDAASTSSAGTVPATANRHSFIGYIPDRLPTWISVSELYRVEAPYRRETAVLSVRHMLNEFDGLRLRIEMDAGKWHQTISASAEAFVEFEPAGEMEASDRDILSQAEQAVAEICLTLEPVKVLFFPDRDQQGFSVLFVAHHALIDAQSKAIAYPFLIFSYLAFQQNDQPPVASRLSYQSFCEGYIEDCETRLAESLEYWRQYAWEELRPDMPSKRKALPRPTKQVRREFDISNYESFAKSFAAIHRVPLSHACLAAISRAYGIWSGDEWLNLALVVHGRGSLPRRPDPSGAVGWISETVPFIIPARQPLADTVGHASARLRELESFGRTYGYLRHLSPDDDIRREFSNHPKSQLSLNVLLGSPPSQGLAPYVTRNFGWNHGWVGELAYSVSGGLTNTASMISLSWETDETMFSEKEIRQFSDLCANEIRSLLQV